MDTEEEMLHGGVANAGAVSRVGVHVLRPSNNHSASILKFLSELHITGFSGAPVPVGLDSSGRERLCFIEGDVAIPAYPDWAQTDDALASVAVLLRTLHDASERVDTQSMTWSSEMADPEGGPVICHNDVCLENVVFRDGRAVARPSAAALGRPGRERAGAADNVRRTRGRGASVLDLVAEHRVVTLTGPGGASKTRPATEVAMNAGERFVDGASTRDHPADDPCRDPKPGRRPRSDLNVLGI